MNRERPAKRRARKELDWRVGIPELFRSWSRDGLMDLGPIRSGCPAAGSIISCYRKPNTQRSEAQYAYALDRLRLQSNTGHPA